MYFKWKSSNYDCRKNKGIHRLKLLPKKKTRYTCVDCDLKVTALTPLHKDIINRSIDLVNRSITKINQ